jgi:hypothetical protein
MYNFSIDVHEVVCGNISVQQTRKKNLGFLKLAYAQ